MAGIASPAGAAPGGEIDRLIDARPLTKVQWTVFLLCALVMFSDGYDIQALALAVPFIAEEWRVAPPVFSVALSASLVGMGLGGALLAPLGDRFGRKPMLVAALLLIGASTLAALLASSPLGIAACRIVTGLGLGVAGVNATALTAEYAPGGRRFLLMTLMNCNVPAGAFLAAFAAPAVIHGGGWRMILVIGGVGPLCFAAIFALLCPESLKWLLARGGDPARIAATARRLLPDIDPATLAAEPNPRATRRSVLSLLVPEHRARTLVVWLAAASGAFAIYLLMSWLPTLLRQAGWSDGAALRGTAAVQLGGICGSLMMAYAVDRGRLLGGLLCGYAASAIGLVLVAVLHLSVTTGTVLFALIGSGAAGMQVVWMAIAIALYPLDLRATSAGWVSAVSRIGAVSAPLAGGAAITAGVAPAAMMLCLLLPLAASATALVVARRHFRTGVALPRADDPVPPPVEG